MLVSQLSNWLTLQKTSSPGPSWHKICLCIPQTGCWLNLWPYMGPSNIHTNAFYPASSSPPKMHSHFSHFEHVCLSVLNWAQKLTWCLSRAILVGPGAVFIMLHANSFAWCAFEDEDHYILPFSDVIVVLAGIWLAFSSFGNHQNQKWPQDGLHLQTHPSSCVIKVEF